MAGGQMGLAGEAGPEAILPAQKMGGGYTVAAQMGGRTQQVPLTRLPNGKLAVKAFANGGVLNMGESSESLPQPTTMTRQFPGDGPGRPNKTSSVTMVVNTRNANSFNRSSKQVRRRLQQTFRGF